MQRSLPALIVFGLALATVAFADERLELRLIPTGQFTMGMDDPRSMANEPPVHRVKIDAFPIDEHNVTTPFDTSGNHTEYCRDLAARKR
jgi:hypothetical protein